MGVDEGIRAPQPTLDLFQAFPMVVEPQSIRLLKSQHVTKIKSLKIGQFNIGKYTLTSGFGFCFEMED